MKITCMIYYHLVVLVIFYIYYINQNDHPLLVANHR